MNIVFGIKDNLILNFDEKSWTFMNQNWAKFRENTQNLVDENDLWSLETNPSERCLRNAKLYPLFNLNSACKADSNDIDHFFWITSNKMSAESIRTWKMSYRLSIEDILKNADYSKTFQNRRNIFNLVNLKTLVKSVVENRVIQFNDIIRNAVMDGYSNELLKFFDEGRSNRLVLLTL